MTGSVLDILIYVFDQYMLAELPEVPERETLAADLERAGFGRHDVERALDWLADLAGERSRPEITANRAIRVFSELEVERIPAACRGYLLQLETDEFPEPMASDWIVGAPEQVRARLDAYAAEGISHFLLWFMDVPEMEGMELFAEEIAPGFR